MKENRVLRNLYEDKVDGDDGLERLALEKSTKRQTNKKTQDVPTSANSTAVVSFGPLRTATTLESVALSTRTSCEDNGAHMADQRRDHKVNMSAIGKPTLFT